MPVSDNPLREGLRMERTPEPNIVVIFGASGDLTKRKLLPALYNLELERLLPNSFAIIGVARRPIGDEAFRAQMLEGINTFSRNKPADPSVWESFSKSITYCDGEFDKPETYDKLKAALDKIDKERGTGGNRLFYLATAPEYFPVILNKLGEHGLAKSPTGGWVRVIVEKPFGRSLATAQELNRTVHANFDENQIYRIDHYLGKETVQNILALRFANGIFEPLWNRNYIDHVQITVAEAVGVEGRGGYYETSGVIRDMIQNHILQVSTLVAMETPSAIDANSVRDEKLKVVKSIRPVPLDHIDEYVIRGQYGSGSSGGKPVPGYRQEPSVAPTSNTETYVAFKYFIDNWRWAGVPFYLRSGKRLPKRVTEIAIQFKQAPLQLFGRGAESMQPNLLALRIQPDEGIALRFGSKVPGQAMTVRPVKMDFRYGASFGGEPPEAYERLQLDCMLGDATLFTRADEVEAAWTLIDPVIKHWEANPPADFPNYEAGSWGPKTSDEMMEKDGRAWRRL